MSTVTLDEIVAARADLAGVIRPTPTAESHSIGAAVGREVWLKPEHRQRTGSFKIRGAYHRMSSLPAGAAVVAGSAGNHAQGVALAARLLGLRATIFMPAMASIPKVSATRSYGADVVLGGATVDECNAAAAQFAVEHDAVFVPPFDHPAVVAGQGTIGLELLDEVPNLASVIVAIGGGGLCAGVAAAVKHRAPHVRVVGVVAAGADSMRRSVASGRPVEVVPDTIADGIALRSPAQLTLDHVTTFIDDVVTVDDDEITEAMLLLLERSKAVVEPAGAAPLAAIAAGRVGGHADAGATVAILGGGNVDPLLLGKCIEHGLGAAGRFLRMRFVTADRPGSLASLTAELAAMHLNVLDVAHHRSGANVPVNCVEVQVVVETRDRDHRRHVVDAFRARGHEVDLVE